MVWVAEDTHIGRVELFKSSSGEALGVVLTFEGITVLLMDVIVVMTKLMHEHVKQHECPRLRLRESAYGGTLGSVMRKPEAGEYLLVSIEILGSELDPEILAPGLEKDRTCFLAMVERVLSISRTKAGQNDALQTLRQIVPVGDDVDECLQVPFADDMAKSPPW